MAQPRQYFLSVIPYQTREDIDSIFAKSTRVINYYEGEGVEEPIFLTIIDESQKQYLSNKGYKTKILDTLINPTDLSNYNLLYHPQENQSSLLKSLGKVIVVSKHYTLLKTTPEKPFKYEGIAAEFFRIPIAERVVTPPYRTKTIVPPTKPPPPLPPTGEPISRTPDILKLILFGLPISLSIITVIIYFKFKQQGKKQPIGILIILVIIITIITSLVISKITTKQNLPTNDLEIKETEEF
jgi:hypothetical protein